MSSVRIMRLQKEISKIINVALQQKMRDQRLQWVTITEVRLTKDLHYAKVFFSHLNNTRKSHDEIRELLTKASGFIKKEIAGAKIMRTIPEISFFYDETEEKAARVDSLLASIKDDLDDDFEDEDLDIDDFLDEEDDYFDEDLDDIEDFEDEDDDY